MVTLEDVRKAAIGLPEVEEASHFRLPGFKVRGKPFAGVKKGGTTGVFSVSQEEAATAVQRSDTIYEQVWRTAGRPVFVGLRVDLARVSKERAHDLVEHAWRNKSPKRLAAAYDHE